MSQDKQAIKWTVSQRAAIETVGRPVLVAASAGTGKTAALSGRVVDRIADPNDPAQADSILVLTFTDAAAEEMRSRIAETLYQRSRQTRDVRLNRQLLLLDRANISTIHAFCKRVLTEFFYLAELDPAFGILDADEQRLLKAEVLDETLEDAWADEALAQGLTILFGGRRVQPGTNSFVDRIIPLSAFLDSVAGREDFYARAQAVSELGTRAYDELQESQKAILLREADTCAARLTYAMTLDGQWCGGDYISKYVREVVLPEVEQCRVLIEKGRYDLCAAHLASLDLGRMPAFKKKQWPEECKDLIAGPIKKVKESLKAMREFALLSDGYAQRVGAQAGLQTKVLLKLLGRFDRGYAQAKRRRNVLDFADLEHRTLKLLKTRTEAAESLRRRFNYILVDEYQDINAVQQGILECLRRDDNLFVVGDVKQSIYGFRQSKPEIFLRQLGTAVEVSKPTMQACRIDLRENFRCRSEIIDFVNALFSRIMTEGTADMNYDARAALVSGFQYPAFAASEGPSEPVEIVLLDEDELDEERDETQDEGGSESEEENTESVCVSASQRQAAWIAQRIQKLVGAQTQKAELEIFDKKTGGTRPVEYRDIVILMRSLSHKARDYVEILRLSGVPVSSQSACGYFEAAEISDCLCLLKVLDNPDRDIELAGLLRSPVFSVTDGELAQVRRFAESKQENSKSEFLNFKQIQNPKSEGLKRRRVSFYEAVRLYVQSGPEDSLRRRMTEVLAKLSDWRGRARNGSLADLLDTIFREHDLLSFYAALPNGAQRRANLLKLHDHAIQFEHFRTTDPGAALGRFVEFLEKLSDEGQDWSPAEADCAGENAVRIMSVHKSKGLEFAVVFAAELNTKFNMRDASGECLISEEAVGLKVIDHAAQKRYPSMAHQVIAEAARKATIAEEMRILYVALTRAREKLICVGGRRENGCINLLRQCAASNDGAPDWMIADGRCHLEWLLTGFGTSEILHRLYVTGADRNLSEICGFHAERVSRAELEEMTRRILEAKRSLKSITEAEKRTQSQSAVLFEHIRHNLNWRYPHEEAMRTGAKFSVSELIRQGQVSDTVFRRIPAAVHEVDGRAAADALAVGSAFHLVFESLDLCRPITARTIEETAAALTAAGKMDETAARQVDAAKVLAFFDSPLGKLTLAGRNRTLREWPFTFALDARFAGASDGGEAVILQGIVDLIVPGEKGLVIVDFKTDRIGPEMIEQHSSRYADQLRLYARAAESILKQAVEGAWIYYLSADQAVEVSLEST
jgi:ATP-dependent helicase/nuclease subunit A